MKKVSRLCCLHHSFRKIWCIMKLTLALMLVIVCSVTASSFSQNRQLNLKMKNANIVEVFKAIERNSDYGFFFKNDQLDLKKRYSFNLNNASIDAVMDKVLSNQHLNYRVIENNIVISRNNTANQAGNRLVKGKVTDEEGVGIPGASVVVKGTTTGIVTDADGFFTLNVPEKTDVLVISFVGMKTQEVIYSGQKELNVTLKVDAIGLDEVVAVGYGTQKKVNLTGSISTVNEEALGSRSVTNLSSGLSGLAAGVTVSQGRGGKVGDEGISIRIRGIGTMNNNNPMVVVDGIVSSMSDIDPNDIASLSVLKDAASAAIYGSRAANGVILITTKRGRKGEMKMTYNGYAGWQKATRLPDYISDFATYMEMNNTYRESNLYTQEDIDEWRNSNDPLTHPNVDWFKEQVGNTAFLQNHSFSFSGGSDVTRYRFSLNYLDQEGLVLGNEQQRYSARANLETNMTRNFVVGGNIFFRWTELDPNPISDGGNGIDIGLVPAIPNIKSPDGRWGGAQHSSVGTTFNPLARLESNEKHNRYQHLLSDIFARWEIIDGLTFNGSVSLDWSNNMYRSFNKTFTVWNFREDVIDRQGTTNSGGMETKQAYRLTSFETLTYQKKFDDHNFSIMAGHQAEKYRWENLKGGAKQYPNDEIQVLDAGLTDISTGGNIVEEAIESYFGRVNYDYKGKYLFEANVRADGSSRFRDGNKWGYFPSTSFAWRVSEEGFMESASFVDNLKLRGSWGMLGNQNINSYYPYQETYSINKNYSFAGQVYPGYASTSLVNQDISWETTEIISAAVEATLFGKWNTTLEYFHKRTDDILAGLPIPKFLGAKSDPTVNLAEMVNQGVEFSTSYNGKIGDVKINVGGHVTWLKNELTDYYEDITTGGKQIGEVYNSYWGYEAVGLFKTQEQLDNAATHWNYTGLGDVEYKDQLTVDTDGDGIPDAGDGKIDSNDKVIIGKSIPTWTFGGNLNLEYKNFDFGLLWQGVADVDGSWMGNGNRLFAWGDRGLLHNMWTDAWSEENPEAKWPRVWQKSDGANRSTSTFWIRDISYLRIKNIQLGYTLPKRLVNNWGLGKVRVYMSSDNPFTITNWDLGYDPETRSTDAVPNTKTLILGINVNF
ncbi:SusC/RagA family TonB-linked outer membrane protein [Prolixibacteraceae bacterium JC049]|nr:SusC/RagA family TonB-linked outer membrane protein [Prolixibacteraceae bacterium JC049]